MVAEQLGVGWEDLTPEVSLTDDLAADSLDLVELGLGLEDEFGIEVPASAINEVRTYRDLVGCVQALNHSSRAAASAESSRESPFVWARIVPAPDHATGDLWRAGRLTPYFAQTIVEDALPAGPGARLELSVSPDVSDTGLRQLEDELAWLRARNIEVSVRRDHYLASSARESIRPHAA